MTKSNFVSHLKLHGHKYVIWVFALVFVKFLISLVLGIWFFSFRISADFSDPAAMCSGVIEIPVSECIALLNIYNDTNWDEWLISENRWNTWGICDSWYWVRCNEGYVYEIYLWSNNLSGSVCISWFMDLRWLYLSHNSIYSFTFSGLESLEGLGLDHNNLSSIDLSGLTGLQSLYIQNNNLSSIDLSGLSELRELYLWYNNLSSIDLSGLTGLQSLDLSHNSIDSINLSGLGMLKELYLWNNNLSFVDLSWLQSLRGLNISDNNFTYFDFWYITWLQTLDASNNNITGFMLPDGIVDLNLDYNNILWYLDLSIFTGLANISMWDNNLTGVSLYKSWIVNLAFWGNNLESFDFSGFNNNVHSISISYNNINIDIEDTNICNMISLFEFEWWEEGDGKWWELLSPNCDVDIFGQQCKYVLMDNNNFTGDIPECLTGTDLLTLWLDDNNLNIYNTGWEIKYSDALVSWLDTYSVFQATGDGWERDYNWMEQDGLGGEFDLFVVPAISENQDLDIWDQVTFLFNLGNIGPWISLSSILNVTLQGLTWVQISDGELSTSWGVEWDICYSGFFEWVWPYVDLVNSWFTTFTNMLGSDNWDGTMEILLADPTFSIDITDLIANSSGLKKYLAVFAEAMWYIGNEEMKNQVLSGIEIDWEYLTLDGMCKLWAFNEWVWFADLVSCLDSPYTPNIDFSSVEGCGVGSMNYSGGMMWVDSTKQIIISGTVSSDVVVWLSLLPVGSTDLDLFNNYVYLSMPIEDHFVSIFSGMLYMTGEASKLDNDFIILNQTRSQDDKNTKISSSVGCLEIPEVLNVKIKEWESWNGAILAPQEKSADWIVISWKSPSKVISVWWNTWVSFYSVDEDLFKIKVHMWSGYSWENFEIWVTNTWWEFVPNQPDSSAIVQYDTLLFDAEHLSDFGFVPVEWWDGWEEWGDEWWDEWDGWNLGWWGWGWSSIIRRDDCPNWDCSPSYYDDTCEVLDTENFDRIWNINNSQYDDEMNLAYLYAYNIGVTDMESIQKADIDGKLNRIAMAKMISNFAIEVLSLQLDLNKDCDFPDVSDDLDIQYDNWVTKACQLWLMWVNVDKFSPFENVNRAQFGTVLSRVLNWNIYDVDGKNWYTEHLQNLNQNWIITNISDPWMEELRWWIFLMLMRTTKFLNN